jgi:phospholipase C
MSRKRSPRRMLLVALAALTPPVLLAFLSPGGPAQARATAAGRILTSAAAARPHHSPIQHVVVLYLENHSFDSLLGFWCDQNPSRCPSGGMPRQVTLSDRAVVTPSVDPDVVPVIDHSVGSQERAMNCSPNGTCKMNGWQNLGHGSCDAVHRYQCISGYRPSQEPNMIALADRFAIDDRFFSQQDDWSFVAHIYAVAGSADGFTATKSFKKVRPGQGWGCDSGRLIPWVGNGTRRYVPSCVPDPSLTYHGHKLPHGGAFRATPVKYVPTIMDEIDQAGQSWKIYGAACHSTDVARNGLKTCMSASYGYHWAICPTFAECLYSRGNDTADSQFFTDTRRGTLPSFSIVTPGDAADSEHNGFSMTTGDDWVGKVASAVMNSPEWDSTVLFITWDDCGCFYDQVSPSRNPDGTMQGPRVPLLIVSPWARPGYTDDTDATFASILAFTEQAFGLPPLTANDAAAYPFTNSFDFHQKPVRPVAMMNRPQPPGDHIQWSQAKEDT